VAILQEKILTKLDLATKACSKKPSRSEPSESLISRVVTSGNIMPLIRKNVACQMTAAGFNGMNMS